jgi:hypothetical protein
MWIFPAVFCRVFTMSQIGKIWGVWWRAISPIFSPILPREDQGSKSYKRPCPWHHHDHLTLNRATLALAIIIGISALARATLSTKVRAAGLPMKWMMWWK